MKYLWLLSLRSVKANKWRSLVNIAVIACSVAMVVITKSFCNYLIETEKVFLLTHLANHVSAQEAEEIWVQSNEIRQLSVFSSVLCGIVMLFAAVSIYGSFAAGIRERSKLMAVLGSLGANDLQKSFVTVAETLLLSVVGIPLGVLLSLPPVWVISDYTTNTWHTMLFMERSAFLLDAEYLLPITLLCIITVLLAALISIFKASKRSSIVLIKAPAGIEIRLKPSFLDRIMVGLFGKVGEIAAASYINQKQNYRFLARSFAIAIILYVNGNLFIDYLTTEGLRPADGFEEGAALMFQLIGFVITALVTFSSIDALCLVGSGFQGRKREFAMLQSIGMSARMMTQMIILEWAYRGIYLIFYTLLGSYLFNFATYGLMILEGIATNFIHPFQYLLNAFSALLLLIIVITVGMVIKLRRMKLVEALKSET